MALFVGVLSTTFHAQRSAPGAFAGGACDVDALSRSEAEFSRLQTLNGSGSSGVSAADVRAASADYLAKAEACYQATYGSSVQHIDDGGVWFTEDGSRPFVTFGTKWGAGSPFTHGANVPGPRIRGGTVTFSYMGDGVDLTADSASAGSNVAITSLPGYQVCYITRISMAFAAWSAVADIQFTQVADNGLPFNQSGATGDIRIGAHTFDGPFAVLAHAYYPPPNGSSASGDVHFDRQESWSCSPAGGIDIGIVAAHEIGHSIGLDHEPTIAALMNPTYNPGVASEPIADDITAASSIYGAPSPSTVVVDFGPGNGVWLLDKGPIWSQLHPLSPEAIVTGDLDGNGVDDIICDFGAANGLWVKMNNSSWSQLHGFDPSIMATADLDGNGKDDLIVGFPGFGTYVYYNNSSWVQLHPLIPDRMAAGNINQTVGDDLVLDFGASFGIYLFKNNTTWQQLHGLSSVALAVADIDGNGKDDVIISFAGGAGTWAFKNNATWFQINAASALRMATGNFDGNPMKDLILDFGAPGIWFFNNGTTFALLHGQTSEALTAGDFDRNGTDDVVVDFGSGNGFWIRLDNGTWVQGHTASPETLNMAHLHFTAIRSDLCHDGPPVDPTRASPAGGAAPGAVLGAASGC